MQTLLKLPMFAVLLCVTASALLGQTESGACKESKYEHRNQIDNVSFRVSQVKGTARDPQA